MNSEELMTVLSGPRTAIKPDMSDWELDCAVDEAVADCRAVAAYAREEAERARAIHALRAREGRTIGKDRRGHVEALAGLTKRLLGISEDLAARHRDPAVVREAARFERLRAGR